MLGCPAELPYSFLSMRPASVDVSKACQALFWAMLCWGRRGAASTDWLRNRFLGRNPRVTAAREPSGEASPDGSWDASQQASGRVH